MGGRGNWNHEVLLEKNKGGGSGSGDVFLKRKQKELEVFPDGPLVLYVLSVEHSC